LIQSISGCVIAPSGRIITASKHFWSPSRPAFMHTGSPP
jgi:hypothetical protein